MRQCASNHACLDRFCTTHGLRGLRASTTHAPMCLQTCMPRAPLHTMWVAEACEPRPHVRQCASNHACLQHLCTQCGFKGLQASTIYEAICLHPCMPRAPLHILWVSNLQASTTYEAMRLQPCMPPTPLHTTWGGKPPSLDRL